MFLEYLAKEEFADTDKARKFLQMGFTRARRHANYKSGKKYDKEHDYRLLEKGTGEDEKARAAAIFFRHLKEAENNERYAGMKKDWKASLG